METANLQNLEQPIKVLLGDGHTLHATGRGNVLLQMKLSNGKLRRCKLLNVLLFPKLYYNLLSVSKALESGKTNEFSEFSCQIQNKCLLLWQQKLEVSIA